MTMKFYHLSDRPFDPSLMKEVSNWGKVGKPKGGLWLAPNHEWRDWVKDNQPEWLKGKRYFEVDVDVSKVLVVDSLEKARQLPLVKHPYMYGEWSFDFEALAQKYSGLWVKPFDDWRFSAPKNLRVDFYVWDVESLVVFDPKIVQGVKRVKKN